jgi:hypothetical protein
MPIRISSSPGSFTALNMWPPTRSPKVWIIGVTIRRREDLAMNSRALLVSLSLTTSLVAAPATLDEGQLDPAWFGAQTLSFNRTDTVDYLWVKPGFTVTGKTLWVKAWQEPVWLGGKRDGKDAAKAEELTEFMPSRLKGALTSALGEKAKVSREEGELVLEGRFVDVNAGSKAAKWLVGMGAGSATATWNLKITDRASGELLVAVHHRCISGTHMSEIQDKVVKWVAEFSDALAADLLEHAKGKPHTR